jgi:hypothetical protein
MRLMRVQRPYRGSVKAFIEATVAPGSTVVTPRSEAFAGLVLEGYERVETRGQATPVIGRLWPRFDLWWRGTHRGAIRHRQLDYYLDEYAFRHNRRRSKVPGRLFYALLEQAVETPPVPYKHLIARRKAPLRPPPAASHVTRSDPTRLQDRLEADG